MVSDRMEEVKQKKQKHMEKSSSSSPMSSPIVLDAEADIAMRTVQMNFDQGEDGAQIGQVGNAVGAQGLGQDMGGMSMHFIMPKIMRRLKRKGGKENTKEAVLKG
jgi:hypothetical protein